MHSPRLRPESEYDLHGIEDKIEPYCSNTVDASENHSIKEAPTHAEGYGLEVRYIF